jgi:RimJ/RimL family protein N-acetyltransferase
MEKDLEGNGIKLRPLERNDISKWFTWFNDRNVVQSLNKGVYPNTFEKQEKYYDKINTSVNDILLGVVKKENDELIGLIGIHNIDWVHRKGEISVVIGKMTSWGKGYATEAIDLMVRHGFEKANLRRLSAGVWASNEASRRCFEKNGFVLEGTIRESFFYNGKYVDEYRLGLLRKNWHLALREKKQE